MFSLRHGRVEHVTACSSHCPKGKQTSRQHQARDSGDPVTLRCVCGFPLLLENYPTVERKTSPEFSLIRANNMDSVKQCSDNSKDYCDANTPSVQLEPGSCRINHLGQHQMLITFASLVDYPGCSLHMRQNLSAVLTLPRMCPFIGFL